MQPFLPSSCYFNVGVLYSNFTSSQALGFPHKPYSSSFIQSPMASKSQYSTSRNLEEELIFPQYFTKYYILTIRIFLSNLTVSILVHNTELTVPIKFSSLSEL